MMQPLQTAWVGGLTSLGPEMPCGLAGAGAPGVEASAAYRPWGPWVN